MQTDTEPAPSSYGGEAFKPASESGTGPAARPARKSPVDYAPFVAGVALLATAGALYAYTVAPSVLPGDYAEFQMSAAILGVPHPTGYPLYILLGKLFTLLPFGDVAYRVNLSSAVYMAGATVMLYAISLRLLALMGRRQWWPMSVLGAAFFAVSPTVWSMALVARSYALNALLVSLVVYSLVSWRHTARARWFYASCFFTGLSMVHHGTTYLLLPAYGLYLVLVESERRRATGNREPGIAINSRFPIPRILFGALAFLAGFSPMLFLVYRLAFGSPYYWGNPSTWKDFFNLLTGGPFHDQVLAFGWGAQFDRLLFGFGELSKQYTPLGIVVGLLGLVVLWRNLRADAWLFALMVVANFAFAMNYALVGYLYFIPTYLIFGILIGIGLSWPGALAVSALQRLFGGSTEAVVKWSVVLGLGALAVVALAARYPGISLRHQTQARDEALSLLGSAPQGASLYMDWEDVSVLRFYRLVYGMRTDLTLHTGDPADWAKWAYCDVTNGVPAYVGKFAGAVPPVVARDFSLETAPMGWRVLNVKNAARYEVPPCGACATCR